MKYFLPALTLLLIAFKLTTMIDWSWWWVLAPLWVPFSIAMVVIAVYTGLMLIVRWLETPQQKQMRELDQAFRNVAEHLRRRSGRE